jgi:hypothetical protein
MNDHSKCTPLKCENPGQGPCPISQHPQVQEGIPIYPQDQGGQKRKASKSLSEERDTNRRNLVQTPWPAPTLGVVPAVEPEPPEPEPPEPEPPEPECVLCQNNKLETPEEKDRGVCDMCMPRRHTKRKTPTDKQNEIEIHEQKIEALRKKIEAEAREKNSIIKKGCQKDHIASALEEIIKKTSASKRDIFHQDLFRDRVSMFGYLTSEQIRNIIERDATSQLQGVYLYGFVKTNQYKSETSNVFNQKDSKFISCWGTGFPCALGTDIRAKFGVKHEMEHAVPCGAQALIGSLCQRDGINDGANKKGEYANHNFILDSIMKKCYPGHSQMDITDRVRSIRKLMKISQLILGLPSIEIFNQAKCSDNLLKIVFSKSGGFPKVRLETDMTICNKIATLMYEDLTFQSGNCSCKTISNPDSGFAPSKMKQFYRNKAGLAKITEDMSSINGVRSPGDPITFIAGIIKRNCERICEMYNNFLSELSSVCVAASILVTNTIFKAVLIDTERLEGYNMVHATRPIDILSLKSLEYFRTLSESDWKSIIKNSNLKYKEFKHNLVDKADNKTSSKYFSFGNANDTAYFGQVGGSDVFSDPDTEKNEKVNEPVQEPVQEQKEDRVDVEFQNIFDLLSQELKEVEDDGRYGEDFLVNLFTCNFAVKKSKKKPKKKTKMKPWHKKVQHPQWKPKKKPTKPKKKPTKPKKKPTKPKKKPTKPKKKPTKPTKPKKKPKAGVTKKKKKDKKSKNKSSKIIVDLSGIRELVS